MIGCINYDTFLDVGTFFSDTISEISNLPNLTKRGEAELSNMNEIKVGSQCFCKEDGEVYFLTGANTWEMDE